MKILILLLFPFFLNAQLTSFIVRGDTLFALDPSTRTERQLTKLPALLRSDSTLFVTPSDLQAMVIDYSRVTNLPVIPTNTNELTNGASFITSAALSPYLPSATAASTYQPIGSYAAAVHAHAYNTLSGIPATFVPTVHAHPESEVTNLVSDLAAKQATLVSATNIKTINGVSVLGSGDLVITPSGIGIPTYSRVTGSNATTTGQALANIAGLSNALVANATYEFEAFLSVSTTAVTTGTGYGVNFSAAGATVESIISGSLTNATDKTLRLNALNTSSQAWLTTSAQTGGILIKGIVVTGANAGNLTVSHLKVTSGTSTVMINSYLKTTRIL